MRIAGRAIFQRSLAQGLLVAVTEVVNKSCTVHPSQNRIFLPKNKSTEPKVLAREQAALLCQAALSDLVKERAINQPKITGVARLNSTDEKTVPFEIGLGSPAMIFSESSLSLNSIVTILKGDVVNNMPLLIPNKASLVPLADTIDYSSPILLRGEVAVNDLLQSSYDLVSASIASDKPYRRARGSLSALNIHEISIRHVSISRDSEFYDCIQRQWENNMNLVAQIVTTSLGARYNIKQ